MRHPLRYTRRPAPILQPYVELFWAIDEGPASGARAQVREHVLPTGRMHVVFRLGDYPLRLFTGPEDDAGFLVGGAVLGGARAAFYIRDVSRPLCSVGAQLRPGAAAALFGAGAGELACRHTPLQDLWGAHADRIWMRLAELSTPAARVDALESALASELLRPRALHPAVAQALQHFTASSSIRRVVRATGYSHRTLIQQFRRAVGLAPKEYCRVLRLQQALRLIARQQPLADVALAAGFSDQSHFSREFHAFAGLAPGEYARTPPADPHHVRRGGVQFPSRSPRARRLP